MRAARNDTTEAARRLAVTKAGSTAKENLGHLREIRKGAVSRCHIYSATVHALLRGRAGQSITDNGHA